MLTQFCKDNSIAALSVFGSYAQNTATDASDVDLLVKFDRPIGLLELIDLQMRLESLLDKKVDLITENELSPYLKDQILSTSEKIYDKAS